MRSVIYAIVLSLFAGLLFVNGAAAQGKNPGKELKAAVDRVDKAAAVINDVMKVAERSIPSDLMDKAKAIVVFPGTLKAAFIVGGQGGRAWKQTALGRRMRVRRLRP